MSLKFQKANDEIVFVPILIQCHRYKCQVDSGDERSCHSGLSILRNVLPDPAWYPAQCEEAFRYPKAAIPFISEPTRRTRCILNQRG